MSTVATGFTSSIVDVASSVGGGGAFLWWSARTASRSPSTSSFLSCLCVKFVQPNFFNSFSSCSFVILFKSAGNPTCERISSTSTEVLLS